MSDGMVAETTEELINRFIAFYRDYYQEEIEQLAQNYPDKQRSLYIDYADLEEFDPDIAEDYLNQPDHMRPLAEEALSRMEKSIDVGRSLARVRLYGLPDTPLEPGTIRVEDDVIGTLVTIRGYVEEASEVAPSIVQAAFECQRCGTLTRIPQCGAELQKPHKCSGCERQGPFQITYEQSKFISQQTATVGPLPESDSTVDGELAVTLEGDLAGEVAQGDRVDVVGVVKAAQEGSKTVVTVSLVGEAVSSVLVQETRLFSGPYLEVPANALEEELVEEFVTRSMAVLRMQELGEFETQSKIITPFLHLLGWNIYHPEVRFEYSDPEVDGGQADYALLGENESPVFIVEAKQEGENLNWHTGQLKKYMRVFQAQYGLLTNGERYMFFCANPDEDGSSELVVLDCALSELGRHRRILAAYGREAIIGARTSLERLAEVAEEGEAEADAGTRDLTAAEQVERTKRIKGIVDDLQEENDGAPIDEVCQRAESEFGIPRAETERELAKLRQHSELYEHPPDHFRIL